MGHKPTNFIAAVEEKEIPHIQDIAQKLREKGCVIRDVLSFTGVISGTTSGNESKLDDLKIKGIKYIEEDGEVRAF
jgi:histidinol-phosphate/aromatic aminotransferase/cobyric acid decarboxylase-like protein